MWTYVQKTGEFKHDGYFVSYGYAGRGEFKNDPASQSIKGKGPLPVGLYHADAPVEDPVVGRYAMRLTPSPNTRMYGRSSFFLHGDSIEHPGLASHGCIVQALPIRQKFWESGDHDIEVISGV